MKAIFVTGGKQYCVSEGDVVYVEKLDAEVGKEVTFDEVLMAGEVFGNPTVKNASVVVLLKNKVNKRKLLYLSINLRRNIVKNKDIDNHILRLLLSLLMLNNYDKSELCSI